MNYIPTRKQTLLLIPALLTILLVVQVQKWRKEMRKTHRKSAYPVLNVIIDRWSPRAMSDEPLDKNELMSLFEAARWAPSSYKNQPWRFIYATRDSKYWPLFLDLLVPANREWAARASVLMVIASNKIFERNKKPARTHSFDTGSAWENLALQGSHMGLVVHGMEGFDYDRARTELNIPEEFDIEAMIAVGKPGKIEGLPDQVKEWEKPSDRKPIAEIAFEGSFK